MSLLLAAGPAAAAGDAARGPAVFTHCSGCHALSAGDVIVGPSLHELFGRKAGTVAGFSYSKALAGSGIIWDEASLRKFLADPGGTVPGTKMQSGAVTDPQQLDDLISYLKTATR